MTGVRDYNEQNTLHYNITHHIWSILTRGNMTSIIDDVMIDVMPSFDILISDRTPYSLIILEEIHLRQKDPQIIGCCNFLSFIIRWACNKKRSRCTTCTGAEHSEGAVDPF